MNEQIHNQPTKSNRSTGKGTHHFIICCTQLLGTHCALIRYMCDIYECLSSKYIMCSEVNEPKAIGDAIPRTHTYKCTESERVSQRIIMRDSNTHKRTSEE